MVLALGLLAAACTSTPTPRPTDAAPTPTPVNGGPETSAAATCSTSDLVAEHGRIEGAAGSRYTTVSLSNVSAVPCVVPEAPDFQVVDATGNVVLGFLRGGENAPIEVVPGEVVTSDIQLSSWCEAPPAQPVQLNLVLDTGMAGVAGGPFPAADDTPPCNAGPGIVASATDWRAP